MYRTVLTIILLLLVDVSAFGVTKVACVGDITSWPGGKGTGKGAPADWERAQLAYELDEAGLMAWDDNPIDNLEALAQAKVPVYTAIGLDDAVVPPSENILKVMERYIALGGPFTVYPMTLGEQKADGHHFPIENPEDIADFMLSCMQSQ